MFPAQKRCTSGTIFGPVEVGYRAPSTRGRGDGDTSPAVSLVEASESFAFSWVSHMDYMKAGRLDGVSDYLRAVIGQFREFESPRVRSRVNSWGLVLVQELSCGKREGAS